jgi:hypothetical protein
MIVSIELNKQSRLHEIEPEQLCELINVFNRHPELTLGEMAENFRIKPTAATNGIFTEFQPYSVQTMKHGYFYYRIILNQTKIEQQE